MADESYFLVQLEERARYEDAPTTTPYRVSTDKFFFPVDSGIITDNPQHMDRANELRGLLAPPPPLINGHDPAGSLSMKAYPNLLAVAAELCGLEATIEEGDGVNEQVTLTGTGTSSGTYTVTLPADGGNGTSAAIPVAATAAEIQAKLEALSGVRTGDIRVTGGPISSTPVVLNFEGNFSAKVIGAVTAAATVGSIAAVETVAGATGTVLDPDGNGLPPNAFLLTYSKRSAARAQTAQIIAAYGPHDVYLKGQGYGVSSISLSADGEMSAELMGLVVAPVADPAETVTIDAPSVLPFRRGDITLTWLTGSAAVTDFNLTIANAIERGEDLSIQSYFMKHMDHTGEPTRLTGSVSMRDFDETDYAAMLAATTFSATSRWIVPKTIGSTGKNYGVWVEMPACVITGGDPDPLSNTRRFPSSFEFGAFLDESSGVDFTLSIVCGVESLATYV